MDSYQHLPLLRVVPLVARTPRLLNIDPRALLVLPDFVGLEALPSFQRERLMLSHSLSSAALSAESCLGNCAL